MKVSKILRQCKVLLDAGTAIHKNTQAGIYEKVKVWLLNAPAPGRNPRYQTHRLVQDIWNELNALHREGVRPDTETHRRITEWLARHDAKKAARATARRVDARDNMEKAEAAFSKPVGEWPWNPEAIAQIDVGKERIIKALEKAKEAIDEMTRQRMAAARFRPGGVFAPGTAEAGTGDAERLQEKVYAARATSERVISREQVEKMEADFGNLTDRLSKLSLRPFCTPRDAPPTTFEPVADPVEPVIPPMEEHGQKRPACADVPPLPPDLAKCPEHPVERLTLSIPEPVLTAGEDVFLVNRDLRGFPTDIKDVNGREILVGDRVAQGEGEERVEFTVVFAHHAFRKKYHHRGWPDGLLPALNGFDDDGCEVVRGVCEQLAPSPGQPAKPGPVPNRWYEVNENTTQDQLPEHGDRLLVEDGEGRVYYAVYSGYLNFYVHRSITGRSGTGGSWLFHKESAETGTGFVKKFLILLPPL